MNVEKRSRYGYNKSYIVCDFASNVVSCHAMLGIVIKQYEARSQLYLSEQTIKNTLLSYRVNHIDEVNEY